MENLLFIDDQQGEVSSWADSPIPQFIAYFKRSSSYKGEYGFSWYEKGDYLFNFLMRPGSMSSWDEYKEKNNFTSTHNDKDSHLSVPKVKHEYNNREDIINDDEYRVPIITFYPDIQGLSLDILLNFTAEPAGAKKKDQKIYWEFFNNTKLFLKTSAENLSFEKPEILLGEYNKSPDAYFETFIYPNDVRVRHLNTTDGVLYIPDVRINISGPISSDAEIWIEDKDGKIIGFAEIKANDSVLELPIQFVIPYRKDKKESETRTVLSQLRDINVLLDQMNNLIFCQSLVKFKYANPAEKLLNLELRPSTDYIPDGTPEPGPLSSEEQQEYEDKQAFSQAVTPRLECSFKHTLPYLRSTLKKFNLNEDTFIVFLTPYQYYRDKFGAAGSSPVYDRSGLLIIESALNSFQIIAHELGHALGLLHSDQDKESDYGNRITSAESNLANYQQYITNMDQLSQQPTAKSNETEIAFQRRYYTELSQKSSLTEREEKTKDTCQTNIGIYDRYVARVAYYKDRINKLKLAKDIDKYTIEDTENVMYHSSAGGMKNAILHPWQTKVIKQLNS